MSIKTSRDPEAESAARIDRIQAALGLRRPDRVPMCFTWRFWPATVAGLTFEQAIYDLAAFRVATRDVVQEFEPDIYMIPPPFGTYGPALEAVGFKLLKWPGHGVDANVCYQYVDKEYMKAEEYDEFIFDPTGFYLRRYLPRIADAFQVLGELPPFSTLHHVQFVAATRAFARPGMSEAWETLATVGRAAGEAAEQSRILAQELADNGFPLFSTARAIAPFDLFADYLRGSKGAMLDMFRNPDRLLAAIDKATALIIRDALASAAGKSGNLVSVPLHWGLDGFMSPDQFDTFFWRPLRTVLMALIENGLVPFVLWEGDVATRLQTIADIPAGKAIYRFERTDMFKAKEILGDRVCIQGNVPPSLLITGSPEEVEAYCRRLIEGVGRDGGFILDGAAGIPDEARYENVKAMVASVLRYGR